MTEQQRPEEDVEGHARIRLEDQASEDDVEGHIRRYQDAEAVDEDEASEDDVQGHSPARRPL